MSKLLEILREAEHSSDGECPQCASNWSGGPHARDCALAEEIRKLDPGFDAEELARAEDVARREEERRNSPPRRGVLDTQMANDLLKNMFTSPDIKDGEAFVISGLLRQVSK